MKAAPFFAPLLRAVIDANVLANALVADLLLNLAYFERLFIPLWSEEILEETRRTCAYKLRWKQTRIDSFRRAILAAFPRSFVSGYAHWIAQCTNDAGDRHVLAVAIEGQAQYVVTFNLRYFKDADLVQPWGIRAVHPEDYLLALNAKTPRAVARQLSGMAKKKEIAPSEVLRRLAVHVPKFSAVLLG